MTKETIHEACLAKMQEQVDELKAAIQKVQESIEGEDNSTAGNKFETARAMGQEELDRINRQLAGALYNQGVIQLIDASRACDTVQLGALVKTSKKNIYISTALGRIEFDKSTVFAVSLSSPIGQNLVGKASGDTVEIAGKKEKIIEVS